MNSVWPFINTGTCFQAVEWHWCTADVAFTRGEKVSFQKSYLVPSKSLVHFFVCWFALLFAVVVCLLYLEEPLKFNTRQPVGLSQLTKYTRITNHCFCFKVVTNRYQVKLQGKKVIMEKITIKHHTCSTNVDLVLKGLNLGQYAFVTGKSQRKSSAWTFKETAGEGTFFYF